MSKIKKITLSVLVFLGLIVGVFLFMFFYQGSTTDIKKVADQFASKPEWVKESETITPPKITCLGDNPCPSLYKTWRTGKNLSKQELQTVIQNSKWNFSVEGDCQPDPNVFGSPVTICSAGGSVDSFDISLRVMGLADKDQGQVVLSVVGK